MSREAGRDQRAAALAAQTRLAVGVASCVLQTGERPSASWGRSRGGGHAPIHRALSHLAAQHGLCRPGSIRKGYRLLDAILAECEAAGATKRRSLPERMRRLYLYQAQLYAELEKYAEAHADCNRALVSYPEWAEVYSVRGLCRAHLGSRESALAELCPLRHRTRTFDRALLSPAGRRPHPAQGLRRSDQRLRPCAGAGSNRRTGATGPHKAVGGYLFHDLLGGGVARAEAGTGCPVGGRDKGNRGVGG